MKDYLGIIWTKVQEKIGSLTGLLVAAAERIAVPIGEGNVEQIRAHAVELKEAAAALDSLADKILADTEDGTLDLKEGAELLAEFQEVLDELEDVATGKDEDDESEETPTP